MLKVTDLKGVSRTVAERTIFLRTGHGQGLGWTPQGQALVVRWAISRLIPPPGKGCP